MNKNVNENANATEAEVTAIIAAIPDEQYKSLELLFGATSIQHLVEIVTKSINLQPRVVIVHAMVRTAVEAQKEQVRQYLSQHTAVKRRMQNASNN